MNPAEFGRWAQEQAARHLTARGCRVLVENYRTRRAEVDLIVADGDDVVFVEVKGRRDARFGTPWEAVDRRKQIRIVAAATDFLARQPQYAGRPLRFDVVAVEPVPGEGRWRVRWLKNAFSPQDF